MKAANDAGHVLLILSQHPFRNFHMKVVMRHLILRTGFIQALQRLNQIKVKLRQIQ